MKQKVKIRRIKSKKVNLRALVEYPKENITMLNSLGVIIHNDAVKVNDKISQYDAFHLYITVPQNIEPIREGDYFTDGAKVYHNKTQVDGYIGFEKIIASTDPMLTSMKEGEEKITEEGIQKQKLNPGVSRLEESFIKEYCDENGLEEGLVHYDLGICLEIIDTWETCKCKKGECKNGKWALKVNNDHSITIYPSTDKIYLSIEGVMSRTDEKEITDETYVAFTDDFLDLVNRYKFDFGGGLDHHTKEELELMQEEK